MSKAQYWIVKYIDDVLRNEPRNVGIVVDVGGIRAARFIGETNGKVDGRYLRGVVSDADVYKQWVNYWRESMEAPGFGENEPTFGSFRLEFSGEVCGINDDSPELVAENLFPRLVERKLDNAASEPVYQSFSDCVMDAFRQYGIFDDGQHDAYIKRDQPVHGKIAVHTPEFVQKNGQLAVMQTIDFTVKQKSRAKDHAGYTAYMHRDIRDYFSSDRKPDLFSIIKTAPEDEDREDVINPIKMLENESQVVRWADVQQRNSLLSARRSAATLH